jgi:imidazolonepropionase-like amidohydrolase
MSGITCRVLLSRGFACRQGAAVRVPLVFIIAVCAIAAGLTQSAALAATIVIHAGHLIAEPGQPASLNQSVIIENGKIVAIKDGFVAGGTAIDLKDSWIMPGLIDMHTHVSGIEKLDEPVGGQIALFYMSRPAEAVLNTLPRVNALLMNGFTTIRNVGDPTYTTYALRDAIDKGIVPGPRMFVAEAQISVAGGDFDPSNWDVRNDLEKFVTNRGNCSGVTECVKVVREEVRRGADVVKFRQAGLPAEDPKVDMVESPEEIKAIIDTAHQLDRRVAAHVNGTPVYLHKVIEAGADTIEHGPLDDVAIALMKKRGTAYTPTLLAGKLIDYRFQDGLVGVGKAYRAGVPIIFGTDLGIFGPERSHEEFALLASAGMPPAQVLRAATVNAAAALGRLGEGLGSIAPGKTADIIAMKIDPLTHIDQLGEPGKVSFVMKEGKVFKDER